jgi:hypothetical protein
MKSLKRKGRKKPLKKLLSGNVNMRLNSKSQERLKRRNAPKRPMIAT